MIDGFNVRNALHTHLLRQLKQDALAHGYHFQLLGNETLSLPVDARYNDKTSWMIRATPDVLALKEKAFLLEGKTKMNDRPNIAMELIPLEIYKEKAEDIYIVAETTLKGGLESCKVIHAKSIEIDWIDIPKRLENIERYERIRQKYPDAYIRKEIEVDGGSGTPYVIISPKVFSKWIPWADFRDCIMLNRRDKKQVLHRLARQTTLEFR